MPIKRKRPRLRIPRGLDEVPASTLRYWAIYGPVVDPDYPEGWPDWESWEEFYATIREEWLERRRRRWREALGLVHQQYLRDGYQAKLQEVPAAERIYQAMQEGRDPEDVQAEIKLELEKEASRLLSLLESS